MGSEPSATAAGTIDVGGDLTVNRLGFGAMRITGEGIWGPPKDRDAAITGRRQLSPRRRRTRSPARSTPAPLARSGTRARYPTSMPPRQ